MRKLMYLIVVIVALGLIIAGCIPTVPPTGQDEPETLPTKNLGDVFYVPTSAYPTIQGAIDAASPGDTIYVEPGMYMEGNIRINKSLTIQGAGRSDTIIDATGNEKGFCIEANNVTIKDLTAKNAKYGNIVFWQVPVIVSNATIDNVALLYSVHSGLRVHHSSVTNLVIEDCLFSGNAVYGLRIDSGGIVQGMTITDSHFDDNGGGGIMSYGKLDGLTVEGGSFTKNTFGIMLGAESIAPRYIKNVYVTGATFDDNNKGGYQYGFYVYVYGSTEHVVENININYCNIMNHLRYGVKFSDSGLEGYEDVVIDATNNWWGHASGPGGVYGRINPAGKPIGKGDAVSENVEWDPWLPQPINLTPHDPVPPGLKG